MHGIWDFLLFEISSSVMLGAPDSFSIILGFLGYHYKGGAPHSSNDVYDDFMTFLNIRGLSFIAPILMNDELFLLYIHVS